MSLECPKRILRVIKKTDHIKLRWFVLLICLNILLRHFRTLVVVKVGNFWIVTIFVIIVKLSNYLQRQFNNSCCDYWAQLLKGQAKLCNHSEKLRQSKVVQFLRWLSAPQWATLRFFSFTWWGKKQKYSI
jgi:hypothetical protein